MALSLLVAAAPALGADAALPRLSGIVAGPHARLAIFASSPAAARVLREGERIGDYEIATIAPDSVIVIGPTGAEIIELEPAKSERSDGGSNDLPPGLSSVQAGALRNGVTIGRLAIEHDNCVRGGLLPGAAIDAEAKVRVLLDAISNVPVRTGPDHAHDAPVKEIAAAMGAGWDAIQRQSVASLASVNACRRLDRVWRDVAGRNGIP